MMVKEKQLCTNARTEGPSIQLESGASFTKGNTPGPGKEQDQRVNHQLIQESSQTGESLTHGLLSELHELIDALCLKRYWAQRQKCLSVCYDY